MGRGLSETLLTTTLIRLLSILALLAPVAASAAGLAPWQFGMTKAEVASYKEFGPYKNFSNGDPTFNGRFHGHKENIQFFFDGGRLRRIGVYRGEGTDSKKAIATFQRAYELLQQDYGKIEVPEMKVTGEGTPPPTVIAVGALANADVTGKTQIAPVHQPKDMFVFASVYRYYVRRREIVFHRDHVRQAMIPRSHLIGKCGQLRKFASSLARHSITTVCL